MFKFLLYLLQRNENESALNAVEQAGYGLTIQYPDATRETPHNVIISA